MGKFCDFGCGNVATVIKGSKHLCFLCSKSKAARRPPTVPATVNGHRNCPGCRFWWFDRTQYGCTKKPDEPTNTTAQLSSATAAGPCKLFKAAKVKHD